MTEIFAFSLKNAARPNLKRKPAGAHHGAGDAWSVAQYPDRAATIVKEVGKNGSEESCLESFLQLNPYGKSDMFLFQASVSRNKRLPMNVGPFARIVGDSDYTVALQGLPTTSINGTNGNHQSYLPVGDSHQEEASCRFLSAVAKRGVTEWKDEEYAWLRGYLRQASRSRAFNAIISDGTRLFAYHAGDGSPLAFRRLNGDAEVACKLMRVDWEPKDLPTEGFAIATSQGANGPGWQKFEPGELIVFSQGEIVFFDTDQPTRRE